MGIQRALKESDDAGKLLVLQTRLAGLREIMQQEVLTGEGWGSLEALGGTEPSSPKGSYGACRWWVAAEDPAIPSAGQVGIKMENVGCPAVRTWRGSHFC